MWDRLLNIGKIAAIAVAFIGLAAWTGFFAALGITLAVFVVVMAVLVIFGP